jgi:hypothetical protein
MTSQAQFWLSILQGAQKPGPAWAPDELLNRIRSHDQPLRAIGDWDQGNHIFAGIDGTVGFIRLWRSGGPQPPLADCERWTELLRWLIQGLCNWRPDQDPKYHTLTALFVVAQYCDYENNMWKALPSDVGRNPDLLNAVAKVVASFGCEMKTREGQAAPIWEQEAVDRFVAADANEDWPGIDGLWASIGPAAMMPHALQSQLIRCLNCFDRSRLVEATRSVAQIIVAMQIADALILAERFELGLSTTSTRLQFACVYSAFHRQKQTVLNPEERDFLSSLLLQISANEESWQKWTTVFNRYPLRYPGLQPALGRALAGASGSALQTYIDSVNLSPGRQGSRNNVAVCLTEFCDVASQKQQRLLWTMAFRRWSDWNFNLANPEQHAFEIAWSELDYPVVAYAINCLDAQERTQAQKKILDQLTVLDNQWHKSVTDCITAFNRLLSELQPYAHAVAALATTGSTTNLNLLPLNLYIPPEVQNDRYLRFMYSVR